LRFYWDNKVENCLQEAFNGFEMFQEILLIANVATINVLMSFEKVFYPLAAKTDHQELNE
jgi:hypothetical protein